MFSRLPLAFFARDYTPLFRRYYAAFYFALALIIMGPLLSSGFILSLDMVFGPEAPNPTEVFYGFQAPVLGARLIPDFLISVSGSIVPMWLVQKAILIGIFAASGFGAHRLPPVNSVTARYYAGILYLINPFVYVRFLSGQWYLLMVYALAPFAIKSFMTLLEKADRKSFFVSLVFTSLVTISSHILVLTLVVYAALYIAKVRHITDKRKVHAYLGALAVAFFFVNSYWLMPIIRADETVLQAITERDLEIFAPISVFISPLVSVLTMHGFWREGYEYGVTIFQPVALFFGVIFWLAMFGFLTTYRRGVTIAFALLGVAAIVLGSGMSGPFEPLFRLLALNVPFVEAFRDSQKFVFLLVLAYIFLGALGLDTLVSEIKKRKRAFHRFVIGAAMLGLASPAILTFPMLWGFHGFVGAVGFPAEWQQAKDYLNSQGRDAGVLILPWDSYIEYGWIPNDDPTARTLSRVFFEQPLVYPKSVIRRNGIFSQSFSPEQAYVRAILDDAPTKLDFGGELKLLGVKHVLLEKRAIDTGFYNFLSAQHDLEMVLDSPTISVFRNVNQVGRAYLSETPNISGNLRAASVTRLAPNRYKIENADAEYVVFVPPNTDARHWKLDGRPPVSDEPGFYGIYKIEGDGVITYQPFFFNVVWYIVSGFSVLLLIAYPFVYGRFKRFIPARRRGGFRGADVEGDSGAA